VRTSACVVEANVNGVVITSPERPDTRRTASSAKWPLENSTTWGTPRNVRSAASSANAFSPLLVSHRLSQRPRISFTYSSKGGMELRATLMGIKRPSFGRTGLPPRTSGVPRQKPARAKVVSAGF
jgi:hypothetical protein